MISSKKGVRVVEVAAVILSVIIIASLTVIPQFFAHRVLREMTELINYAIYSMDDSVVKDAVYGVHDTYRENSTLLLLIYPHPAVSDLEFAIESASAFAFYGTGERGRMLTELYRVRACLLTLADLENPMFMNIL